MELNKNQHHKMFKSVQSLGELINKRLEELTLHNTNQNADNPLHTGAKPLRCPSAFNAL